MNLMLITSINQQEESPHLFNLLAARCSHDYLPNDWLVVDVQLLAYYAPLEQDQGSTQHLIEPNCEFLPVKANFKVGNGSFKQS